MDVEKNTLGKQERIKGAKRIDVIFSSGDSFISYPLRIVYVKRIKENVDLSMLVSVSKKRFKRAVKRNRVKRLVRESFRLNKTVFENLCQQYDIGIDIVFLYLKNELPGFHEIENAILKAASTLENRLKKNNGRE